MMQPPYMYVHRKGDPGPDHLTLYRILGEIDFKESHTQAFERKILLQVHIHVVSQQLWGHGSQVMYM